MFESIGFWQSLSFVLLILFLLVCIGWMNKSTLAVERAQTLNEHANRAERLHTIIHSFLTQEMVDAQLRALAAKFAGATRHQGQVLTNPKDEGAIIDAAKKVEQTKAAFWQAHGLVRTLTAFTIDASIKTYLPQSSTLHSA